MENSTFLERKLNITKEKFQNELANSNHFHFSLPNTTWSDLCDYKKLDHILNYNNLTTKSLKLFREGSPVPDYLLLSNKGDEVDKQKVLDFINEHKYSIKINNIAQFDRSLTKLSRELSCLFNRRVNINLYFTPKGGGSCFRPHQDAYDIFILQVEGQKKWQVAEGTQHFFLNQNEKDKSVGESAELNLKKGDALYLPAKIAHRAFCAEDDIHSSVHLTIGMHELTYKDFMEFLIDDPKAALLFKKELKFKGDQIDSEEVGEILGVFMNGYLNESILPKMLDKFYQQEIHNGNTNIAPFDLSNSYSHDE